jgi:hypothetical protein
VEGTSADTRKAIAKLERIAALALVPFRSAPGGHTRLGEDLRDGSGGY